MQGRASRCLFVRCTSRSGLLKRYLTRFREAAAKLDAEEELAARQARARARARTAEARGRELVRQSSARGDGRGESKRITVDTAQANASSAFGMPPTHGRPRRARRPRTVPRLRPPVSPFVARVTLTEDVGKPVVGFGGKKRPRRQVQSTRLPDIGPHTPTTFSELVDKSESMREIVKDDYLSGKTLVRSLHVLARCINMHVSRLACPRHIVKSSWPAGLQRASRIS